MAKPTKSKGIFYKGYEKGKQQGNTPAERSPQDLAAPSSSPMTDKGRVLYSASNVNTEQSMRKPFGGGKKK